MTRAYTETAIAESRPPSRANRESTKVLARSPVQSGEAPSGGTAEISRKVLVGRREIEPWQGTALGRPPAERALAARWWPVRLRPLGQLPSWYSDGRDGLILQSCPSTGGLPPWLAPKMPGLAGQLRLAVNFATRLLSRPLLADTPG